MRSALLTLASLLLVGQIALASEEEFADTTIDIGMVVSDLEKSLAFYKDVIGMVQVGRTSFDKDADFGKRSGLTDSLPLHVEVLKLGQGAQATELKLMTFGDKAKRQENKYIHTHTGIQYITILVTQLEPILQRIKENNVELLGESPINLEKDLEFVLVQDPDGTFVELIGPVQKSDKRES